MAGVRSGARQVRRLVGVVFFGAPLVLGAFMACGGGAPGDTDGGAGNGSDAGGADGDSGGSGSGANGSGGGPGGADGSGGTGASIELDEYCERHADLYYDYLQACYGAKDFPESYRAEYVERIEGRCMNAEGAVEEGRLDYDAAAAAACVAELEDVDCVAGESRPVCKEVFEGQSEPGDDCYAEETLVFLVGMSTCNSGYCAGDTCPGTCEAFPATGEACDGTCQPGDYCDQEERCQALPEIGEPCPDGMCTQGASCFEGTCFELTTSDTDTCDEEVLCAGPTVCVDGTCRSSVELGDPCRLSVHCPSPSTCREDTCQLPGDEGATCGSDADCGDDLYCAWWVEPPVCTAYVPLGEVCAGEASTRCAPEDACVQGPEEFEARCRERVGEGESCADGFQLCEDGVYCSADLICEPPGAEGESCWSVHPCEEGLGCHCAAEDTEQCAASQQVDGDTCQPLLANGEPCFTYAECESGECDLSVSSAPDEPGVCFTYAAEACLP